MVLEDFLCEKGFIRENRFVIKTFKAPFYVFIDPTQSKRAALLQNDLKLLKNINSWELHSFFDIERFCMYNIYGKSHFDKK